MSFGVSMVSFKAKGGDMLRSVSKVDSRVFCGKCRVKMGQSETLYVFRGEPWHEQCFIEALVRAIQVFELGFRITNPRGLRQKATALYRELVGEQEFKLQQCRKLPELKAAMVAAKDKKGTEADQLRAELAREIARLDSFILMRDALEQVFKMEQIQSQERSVASGASMLAKAAG